MNSVIRTLAAAAVAIAIWLAAVLLLMRLPSAISFVALFLGLALFLIGAKLALKWFAAIGGILMFAGVFAAALLGAL